MLPYSNIHIESDRAKFSISKGLSEFFTESICMESWNLKDDLIMNIHHHFYFIKELSNQPIRLDK